MKSIVFIGSRLNVLEKIKDFPELNLIGLFIQENSLLHQRISEIDIPENTYVRMFNLQEKAKVISEIESLTFDVLIGNGCPFILPVSKMTNGKQLFINMHPTLLPELKGKTPLNGVFMTHQKAIGSTLHYMDDGIDTGAIIAQQKVDMSNDIDQGLVYKISFDLEGPVFVEGMKLLQTNDFKLKGVPQKAEGSYFNRTDELQKIIINSDTTDMIIDKIKSFGIKSQGSHLNTNSDIYKIYSAEKIVNEYLLVTYKDVKPGEVVFKYEDKVILRTIDGMIKLVDYEIYDKK